MATSELPRKELKAALSLKKQAVQSLSLSTRKATAEMTSQAQQTFSGAKQILLLHGPNLNLLGFREPEKYGTETLATIEERAAAQAASYGASLSALQSNHEGVVIDRIHAARTDGTDAIIINAGAWTHTSVALRDALLAVEVPFIELHISNTHARESFRHHSYLADKASAVILGMGTYGYTAAVDHCVRNLRKGQGVAP